MANQGDSKREEPYSEEFGEELVKCLRVNRSDADDFLKDIKSLCQEYRRIVENTPLAFSHSPFNIDNSKRIRYLESHVIKPISKIREVIRENYKQPNTGRAMLFPGLDEWQFPKQINYDKLDSLLYKLQSYTNMLLQFLEGQVEYGSITSEVKLDIVTKCLDFLRDHFPMIKQTRGVYNKKLGRKAGITPNYIHLVYKRITGSHNSLDDLIKDCLLPAKEREPKTG